MRRESLYREPSVTPTMKCASCGETLLYGLERCRYCEAPVDEEYARRSAIYRTYITQACSLANNITSIRPVIGFLAAGELSVCVFGYPLRYAIYLLGSSLLYSGAVVRWRWRYGEHRFQDEEFTEAQKKMKRELHMWLALIAIEVIVLLVRWNRITDLQ
ncbi:MAG TPA: hypothetical protein VEZ90_15095 [Blastocatellia bacterium]|nr:hypothetical protein [Blastocatellia bacterium]